MVLKKSKHYFGWFFSFVAFNAFLLIKKGLERSSYAYCLAFKLSLSSFSVQNIRQLLCDNRAVNREYFI